jgi:hypothetical protein
LQSGQESHGRILTQCSLVVTEILKEHTASILKGLFASISKQRMADIDVQCFKTPETIYQNTRCHTAKDENLRCHIIPTFTP